MGHPRTGGRDGLAKQLAGQLFSRHIEVVGDVAENFSEGADSKLFVIRNGDVVLGAFQIGTDTDVAASLASGFIAETAQGSHKVIAADIAGKLQAGMTSSLTM